MFWKSLLLIFLNLLFLISPTYVYAAGATLSLSPSSGTINKGCSYSSDIMLNTGLNNTDGVDVILHFDPAAISITSITTGTLYPDYPSKSFNNSSGVVNISGLSSTTQIFNGTGKFATINYTVNPSTAAFSTPITFDFDPTNKSKTTDSNVVQTGTVTDILDSVTNGNFTVGSGTCGVSPSSTPLPVSSTPTLTPFPQGAPSFSPTPTALSTPRSNLPGTGFEGPTFTLTLVGSFLVILGIIGLSLL